MSKFLHDHDAAVADNRAMTIPRHFSRAKKDLSKVYLTDNSNIKGETLQILTKQLIMGVCCEMFMLLPSFLCPYADLESQFVCLKS